MKIGKPKRIYTIEPIQNPVPKTPVEEPDREPKRRPVSPVDREAAGP